MDLKNFVTCSQCLRVLEPYIEYEIEHAMVHNYHCEKCCYYFSIYSITKTRLAEMNGTPLEVLADELGNWRNRNE